MCSVKVLNVCFDVTGRSSLWTGRLPREAGQRDDDAELQGCAGGGGVSTVRGAGELLGAHAWVPARVPRLECAERAAAVPADTDDWSVSTAGHRAAVPRALLYVPQDHQRDDLQLVLCDTRPSEQDVLQLYVVQLLTIVCAVYCKNQCRISLSSSSVNIF